MFDLLRPVARRAGSDGRGSPRVAEGRGIRPSLRGRAIPTRGRSVDDAGTVDVLHASPRRVVDAEPLLHLVRVGLGRLKPTIHTTEVVEPESSAGKGDGDPP